MSVEQRRRWSTHRPDNVLREIIAKDPQTSFRTVVHDFPSAICGWVAHPEYEIHLIEHTSGTLIAGDYVGPFVPGHLSIVGPMLPHEWVSDIGPGEVAYDRDVLVQFTDEWVHDCMRAIPELQSLDGFLRRSGRGLEFFGGTAVRGADLLRDTVRSTSGPTQVARFIELLQVLATAPEGEAVPLASTWLGTSESAGANAAMEAGLTYIFDNLTGDIRLSTAAGLAYMSETTFSKYFRRASGMSFSDMVKRLRINHARRLLDTSDLSVAQVAAASGYRNLSNFNRQFRAELGMTPSEFRRVDPVQKPPAAVVRTDLQSARPDRTG